MNIIFAGTPDFAIPCLQALIESEHKLVAVYTQPDRPAGRGLTLQMSPVKQVALAHQIPIFQPESLRDTAELDMLKAFNADLMVVVAYGLILPKAVLTALKYGCINVHASLLPRWRGAAPIQHAILTGDKETGITIMQMETGLDTGPILNQIHCPILPTDTAGDLFLRLAKLGEEALLIALAEIQSGRQKPYAQDNHLATYAKKIDKQQARINWNRTAIEIERQIRAFNPWPITWSVLQNQHVRIWQAEVIAQESHALSSPGQIVATHSQGIDVATAKGTLRLKQLQLSGGKINSASELLRSKKLLFAVGNCFEN